MCRFKLQRVHCRLGEESFNTSYVSVQVTREPSGVKSTLCFNTSYVSVQAAPFFLWLSSCWFQYILCVGSSYIQNKGDTEFTSFQYILCVGSRCDRTYCTGFNKQVSIHPMCRFKATCFNIPSFAVIVSIHPMCRFKKILEYIPAPDFPVSIHPMCRFKWTHPTYISVSFEFQYILCVGSRKVLWNYLHIQYIYKYPQYKLFKLFFQPF